MKAFVGHANLGASRFTTIKSSKASATCVRRNALAVPVWRMNLDEVQTPMKDASVETEGGAYTAPSLDNTAFSDFVTTAQTKYDEIATKVQDLDAEEIMADVKSNGIGLIDNLLAGDWLNRGELYGAVQLVFVLLLLRSPGILDGIIGFLVGPATLLAGGVLSGKAMWDLGRKQLSIWPAPVPDGQLKTEGIYAQIRHPIYAGLILASLGFAVSTGSPERFALTAGMAAFLMKKIEVEEAFLKESYDEWADYESEVPYKLVPKVW